MAGESQAPAHQLHSAIRTAVIRLRTTVPTAVIINLDMAVLATAVVLIFHQRRHQQELGRLLGHPTKTPTFSVMRLLPNSILLPRRRPQPQQHRLLMVQRGRHLVMRATAICMTGSQLMLLWYPTTAANHLIILPATTQHQQPQPQLIHRRQQQQQEEQDLLLR